VPHAAQQRHPVPGARAAASASAGLTDHLTPRRVVALVLVALIAVVIGQNRSDVRIPERD
jgi:hypothetical protein